MYERNTNCQGNQHLLIVLARPRILIKATKHEIIIRKVMNLDWSVRGGGHTMSRDQDLKSLFYASFDESAVNTFLSKVSKMPESERRSLPNFLGEGAHFQCFELSSRPLALVVNVAKSSFAKKGTGALERWQKAVSIARSIEGETLVPPMDVITAFELIAIVMPRGRDIGRDGATVITAMLFETAKALGSVGLVLDDYPQLREAMGVPFIIDWSDLAFLNQR